MIFKTHTGLSSRIDPHQDEKVDENLNEETIGSIWWKPGDDNRTRPRNNRLDRTRGAGHWIGRKYEEYEDHGMDDDCSFSNNRGTVSPWIVLVFPRLFWIFLRICDNMTKCMRLPQADPAICLLWQKKARLLLSISRAVTDWSVMAQNWELICQDENCSTTINNFG